MVVKMSDTSDSDLPQMMAETIKKMHRAVMGTLLVSVLALIFGIVSSVVEIWRTKTQKKQALKPKRSP
jgi:hypothetical protein